jgi:hypothetical protein
MEGGMGMAIPTLAGKATRCGSRTRDPVAPAGAWGQCRCACMKFDIDQNWKVFIGIIVGLLMGFCIGRKPAKAVA